ncbi:ParA family protein [Fructilactobacillus sanfranciscensis]|uniref:Peptide transporter n=1 Tax=Fructilactobacillus sanfranciscensis TaxID=1625 RepID=A0A5C4TJM5_FRUSA|nr:AAA family ATPase [Fructilactobacillus sanfranciscensis]TNK90034.1 peptide transporter [Fructilactobacillus sanfranciscensis]TNK95235.1 peptide transporter [Fructilactobacillus sanfranciscensis]TNK98987.1 peptide transporter [Fructilactobacillus sanfranciscensis]
MKKIGFIAEKGGAGKTTQTYNFGSYLADKGNRVLLIDLDHQLSLSHDIFGIREDKYSSVNMFRDLPVKVYNVKDNIDLIAGSLTLELLEKEISLSENEMPSLVLSYWLEDHKNELNLDSYDYILFDTHPDFGIINRNVTVASDVIISPLEPNLFGWATKARIQGRVDAFLGHLIHPITRKPFVDTKLYFINNKVEHNTRESRELIEKTNNDQTVIATIPNKQLFKATIRKNKSITNMSKEKTLYQRNRTFFEKIDTEYRNLKRVIDKTK